MNTDIMRRIGANALGACALATTIAFTFAERTPDGGLPDLPPVVFLVVLGSAPAPRAKGGPKGRAAQGLQSGRVRRVVDASGSVSPVATSISTRRPSGRATTHAPPGDQSTP